jgi:F-type H+-transporting ATPase subunit delta
VAGAPTAKRYAQALFHLAQEQGKLEPWLAQIKDAEAALAEPTVATYLNLPRVAPERKLEVLGQLLAEADLLVRNALGLLVSRKALGLLPSMVDEYTHLLDESLGRVHAEVTSAVSLSVAQQARLQEILGEMLQKKVVLEVKVDPEIMGGIVVRVGDQVIDGSVRMRLLGLRQRLAQQAIT